jgi:hypothetical protein
MTVSAVEPLSDFVFGFQISTASGAVVFGTNTATDGFGPESFSGQARVELALPSVDLAPGLYVLDAAVHARGGAPYDYRRDVLRFEVTADQAVLGTWSPPRRWSFSGGVVWSR